MFRALLLFALVLEKTSALIGYDCGSRNMNVTTISLRDIGECDIPESTISLRRTHVQLLQIKDYSEINIIQCKLEIHRTVYYCGLNSHVSIVLNGENEYIHEINKDECRDLHRTGIFSLDNSQVIHGIRANDTYTYSVIFAGSVTQDGNCKGADYSDPFGTWQSVVVQGTIKVSINEYVTRANLNNDNIYLRYGTVCPFSQGGCLDLDGAYTFWEPIPTDNCKFNRYGILYEGVSSKMLDHNLSFGHTIYCITAQDLTFALTAKGREVVCGHTIIKTDHPKLIILETAKGKGFAHTSKLSFISLDVFAYINSKFIYAEKSIGSRVKQLYRNIVIQRCALESQSLRNSFSMATYAPDVFALDFMKEPGYMAVAAGEVVYIVKCIPVEVKVERSDRCYAELQVTRNNNTYYLTPRTRILKSKGTRILCNALLPSFYYLGDEWYKILPRPIEAKAPATLKYVSQSKWKYNDFKELSSHGIYTEGDLKEARDRIMHPLENSALLNDFARELRGGYAADNAEDKPTKTMMREKSAAAAAAAAAEEIIGDTWDRRLWIRFVSLGSFGVAFLTTLVVVYIVKNVLDIIIRAYTLHSVYGCSIHLLAALWSTVAHLLLHRRRSSATKIDGTQSA